jgi:hypothetical protein
MSSLSFVIRAPYVLIVTSYSQQRRDWVNDLNNISSYFWTKTKVLHNDRFLCYQ